MCYASHEDFGWSRKETTRKPETRPERKPAETPEPEVQEEGSRLWTFLARRRESRPVKEPTTERIREKV